MLLAWSRVTPLATYTQVLGLDEEATITENELKKAFRKACLKHHLDQNAGDPEATSRFQVAPTRADPTRVRAGGSSPPRTPPLFFLD